MMLKFHTKIVGGKLCMITSAGNVVEVTPRDIFRAGVAFNMRTNHGFPPIKFN